MGVGNAGLRGSEFRPSGPRVFVFTDGVCEPGKEYPKGSGEFWAPKSSNWSSMVASKERQIGGQSEIILVRQPA